MGLPVYLCFTAGLPDPWFTGVQGVVDFETDRQLSVDEAVKAGILHQSRNVYVNKATGEEMTLTDAVDSGLLIVEYDNTSV